MSSCKAPFFWRYHFFAIILLGAVFAGIIYIGGLALHAGIQTLEAVQSARMSGQINIQATTLSAWQKCALITVQDPDFYGGLSLKHSLRVALSDTTITHIVARGCLKNYKPGIKGMIQMMVASYLLDRFVSKDDQLTLFLNAVSFDRGSEGGTMVGFENAAGAYFNRSTRQLSEEEYLALIGKIPGPKHFSPQTHPKESSESQAKLRSLVTNHCGSETGVR